jgi:hypothetical protein
MCICLSQVSVMLARVIECLRTHSNIETVLNDIKISDIDGFELAKRVHDNKADTSASL